MISKLKAWQLARRWRKAMMIYDKAIREAQKAHAPVAHLIHAKQQFAHDCLRKAVGS